MKVIVVLILLTIPTLLSFFNSQFFYTQDHIFIARLHQMSKALSDGYFPVRWAPDLRFGEPIFNFYAPLPYYLGALIKLLGFNFIWVAKILFILSSILSALTMYIFCRKLFSSRAAILGATLYVYAPYRAVDLYVRGTLSEAFAFIFFPLIFYASLLVSQRASFFRISLLGLSLAGLFMTHNVTTLTFMPFLILWWIYLVVKQRLRVRAIASFCGAGILASGLAAFFLLPALLENQFIQTKYLTVGYFDFRAHFVAFYQFFSPYFGYGSSLWGPKDDMSFQIGLVHWAVLALAALVAFVKRSDKKLLAMLSFLGFTFFLSVFLQHNKSTFVWERVSAMAFIQFPWRFLAISIFIVSITGAAISDFFKNKFKYTHIVVIAAVILVNIWYFKPRNFVDDSFFEKFLDTEKMHQGVDLTKDYFPIWVRNERVEYFGSPRAISGRIEVFDFEIKTAKACGSINVLSDAQIEMPITYFPGWEVKANGQVVNLSQPSIQGLITFGLPKGEYQIDLALKDTPVRMIGNTLSIFTLLLLVALLSYKKFNHAKFD